MKILYNWLKDFVDVTAPPKELAERLSMSGIATDSLGDTPAGPLLDADLTTNRPDCLGHYGIAREVAALYRLRAKPGSPKLKESAALASQSTRVDIECPDLCGRFTARVIRGVKVGPSRRNTGPENCEGRSNACRATDLARRLPPPCGKFPSPIASVAHAHRT